MEILNGLPKDIAIYEKLVKDLNYAYGDDESSDSTCDNEWLFQEMVQQWDTIHGKLLYFEKDRVKGEIFDPWIATCGGAYFSALKKKYLRCDLCMLYLSEYAIFFAFSYLFFCF